MIRYKSGSQKTKPEVLCSRGTFGNVAVIPDSRRAHASAWAFPWWRDEIQGISGPVADFFPPVAAQGQRSSACRANAWASPPAKHFLIQPFFHSSWCNQNCATLLRGELLSKLFSWEIWSTGPVLFNNPGLWLLQRATLSSFCFLDVLSSYNHQLFCAVFSFIAVTYIIFCGFYLFLSCVFLRMYLNIHSEECDGLLSHSLEVSCFRFKLITQQTWHGGANGASVAVIKAIVYFCN